MRNTKRCVHMLALAAMAAFGLATAANATLVSVPSSIDFGDVPINTTLTLPVDLSVTDGFKVFGAGGAGVNTPFSFNFNTCDFIFTGPGTCTIKETFSPVSLGPVSGNLIVSECPVGGGFCDSATIPVTGRGVSVASATPAALDFGSVVLGTVAAMSSTIKVDAGYTLEFGLGSGLNPPFSFDFGTCGGFPGPGSCTISEAFLPTVLGPASGLLNLAECPVLGTCIEIPVSLSGTGVSNLPGPPGVPEPASIAMFAAALAFVRRRRKQ